MKIQENESAWWTYSSIRICHAKLDPDKLAKLLDVSPTIAQQPGESKIHHGQCKSAGYLCISHRTDDPVRPDQAFLWTESFILERQPHFHTMLRDDYDIDVYIAVFSNVLALGFDLPPTPTLWKLGIPIGIEFFAS